MRTRCTHLGRRILEVRPEIEHHRCRLARLRQGVQRSSGVVSALTDVLIRRALAGSIERKGHQTPRERLRLGLLCQAAASICESTVASSPSMRMRNGPDLPGNSMHPCSERWHGPGTPEAGLPRACAAASRSTGRRDKTRTSTHGEHTSRLPRRPPCRQPRTALLSLCAPAHASHYKTCERASTLWTMRHSPHTLLPSKSR